MQSKKHVSIDAVVEFAGYGAFFDNIQGNAPGTTGDDVAHELTAFSLQGQRGEIDASTLGTMVDVVAKGTHQISVSMGVRPSSDLIFVRYLAEQYNSEDDTPIVYRKKRGDHTAENPQYTFSLAVTKLPPLGGQRGSLLSEGNMDLRVNTPVDIDYTGTVVTIGG